MKSMVLQYVLTVKYLSICLIEQGPKTFIMQSSFAEGPQPKLVNLVHSLGILPDSSVMLNSHTVVSAKKCIVSSLVV